MNDEYTLTEMLEWLQKYFKDNNYEVSAYSKEFSPARVALYCYKTIDNKIIEEIIVEPTKDKSLCREDFFPIISIPNIELPEKPPIRIPGASPVRFYQYYFPNAKIFLAYPDYVKEDKKFDEFKNFCIEKGIGLLNTSEAIIKEIIPAHSLFTEICTQLHKAKGSRKNIENIIKEYLENNLHYLVYYPDPKYQRSALIEKEPGKISLVLIDLLQNLKNIQYSDKLKKLSDSYRDEHRIDYDIVLSNVRELWTARLGLEYPEIHRHLEEILLRENMYRDHFIHQFQVFLIGAYILDKMYSIKTFKKILNDFEKFYKSKIEDAWLAASTYHDFNYGLQKFDIWLLRFFQDTLSIKNEEAKENLNKLNLDSAMVRESLADSLTKMAKLLNLNENAEKKTIKYFYEKVVRDRNHGVLSALSILKLCEVQKNLKINFNAMLQAALAIATHDEDIWEALCGCKGYLGGSNTCDGNCSRNLYRKKKVAIYKQDIYSDCGHGEVRCESWERNLMQESVLKKIKFNDYPLVFLLIYCDAIQEEGRIIDMSYNKNNLESMIFEIEKNNSENFFNNWVKEGSEKRFKDFKKTCEAEANKLEYEFLKHNFELSDESIIYKQKNDKWKILDKKILYEIKNSKGIGSTLQVKPIEKECYLNKINASNKNIRIELIIDGLEQKFKELIRISWVLEDKFFQVRLQERGTELYKNIEIDGHGGG